MGIIQRHLEDGHKINRQFILFAVVTFLVPYLSYYIATFRGISDISLFNAGNILFLGVLTVLFMVIRTMQFFNDDNKTDFLIGVIITTIGMIAVVYGLLVYSGLG